MKGNLFLFYIFSLSIISCDCPKSADLIYYKKEKKLKITTKNAFIDTIVIHEEPEIRYDFVDGHKDDVKIYRKGNEIINHIDLDNIDFNYFTVKGNLNELLLKKGMKIDVELYLKPTSENNYDSNEAEFTVTDTSSNKIVVKYGGGCK